MAKALTIIGGVTLTLCAVGLLLVAISFAQDRRYWWAAASTFCMAILIFLGLAGSLLAEGWWK